jgi:signal peptidase I
MTEPEAVRTGPDTSTVATLQSLIVAFVLAMTFRGFVTEGFAHAHGRAPAVALGSDRLHVPRRRQGVQAGQRPLRPDARQRLSHERGARSNAGFDVVVFKNPTDPDGDAENYIKRLIGLPNEAVWLTDGDVFVAPPDEAGDLAAYAIQRKPEPIQRAVWQPVHDSDFIPVHKQRLAPRYAVPWSGEHWQTHDRRDFRCDTADETTLTWDDEQIVLTDWTPYNMFSLIRTGRAFADRNISDLRVSADIVADETGLSVTFELEAREHVFQFKIADGRAVTRIRPLDDSGNWVEEQSAEVSRLRAGRVYSVEFWHVDQAMSIFVNGRRAGDPLEYDWLPRQRIERSFGVPFEVWMRSTPGIQPTAPVLRWAFAGSPVTLHRVRVDRDLYYRADTLTSQAVKNPTQPGHETTVRPQTPAFGTHPDKPAILGPDHFFMLGDNSPASSDSRLWGNPHPFVVEQIDDSPFLVHRKLLLGKAWVVYFPALYPLSENGRGVIPDFGRLRFIR